MKIISKVFCSTALLQSVLLFTACNSNGKKEADLLKKNTVKTAIKKAIKPLPNVKYQRPPIVNIVDTLSTKKIIIYCKDSAAMFDRISLKLGKIYGIKLADYIKKNNLKVTGSPMAWYTKFKAPYFFEAGIPVNKKGGKALPGVLQRELNAGKVVIAHFYGPYDLISQGYDAIKEWMKDNKKISAGIPYEIYVTDPVDKSGKPVDPYKVQTDIVFPVR